MGVGFAGRFVALLRILCGPLAGSLHLPYPRFLLANVAGGGLAAGGITLVVHILGSAAQRGLSQAGWILFAMAALTCVLAGLAAHRSFDRRAEAFARETSADTR